MARQPRSADYERLPGASRRYAPKGGGESISRREYENLRFREMGVPGGLRQAQEIRRHPEFSRLSWFAAKASGEARRNVEKAGSDFFRLFAKAYVVQSGPRKGQVRATARETQQAPKARHALVYSLGFTHEPDWKRYMRRADEEEEDEE